MWLISLCWKTLINSDVENVFNFLMLKNFNKFWCWKIFFEFGKKCILLHVKKSWKYSNIFIRWKKFTRKNNKHLFLHFLGFPCNKKHSKNSTGKKMAKIPLKKHGKIIWKNRTCFYIANFAHSTYKNSRRTIQSFLGCRPRLCQPSSCNHLCSFDLFCHLRSDFDYDFANKEELQFTFDWRSLYDFDLFFRFLGDFREELCAWSGIYR
jgi:hypothetical protein